MGDFDADLARFAQEFVPNVQGSTYYPRWVKSSPVDAARWVAFRDALLAKQNPTPPAMSTKFGKALVAAGKEHMSISRIVGLVTGTGANPPLPPPPTPPPGGVAISGLDPIQGVFRNAGAYGAVWSPPQFAEITSSTYGPGYDITCTDSDSQPWPDYTSLKAVLTKTPMEWAYFGGAYEGKTDIWDGYFMLPATGNASLPSQAYWQPGTFWEYHSTGTSSGHTFGLDTHWYPGQYNLRATYGYYNANGDAVYDYYVLPPPLQFDHWYHFVWTIHWSYTSGSISLTFDGVYPQGLDLPGSPDYNLTNVPTMYTRLGSQQGTALQFGWYGARLYGNPSNQIRFAGITLSRS